MDGTGSRDMIPQRSEEKNSSVCQNRKVKCSPDRDLRDENVFRTKTVDINSISLKLFTFQISINKLWNCSRQPHAGWNAQTASGIGNHKNQIIKNKISRSRYGHEFIDRFSCPKTPPMLHRCNDWCEFSHLRNSFDSLCNPASINKMINKGKPHKFVNCV